MRVVRVAVAIGVLTASTSVAAPGSYEVGSDQLAADRYERQQQAAEQRADDVQPKQGAITLGAMRASDLLGPWYAPGANKSGMARSNGSQGGTSAVSASAEAAVSSSGLPQPALRAYRNAEQVLARVDPSCAVSWTLLAGIGAVESSHGQYGGAVVGRDGRSNPLIYGLPLNGAPGIASISDSDGGQLDNDAVWDRAVGPMQFIPTTWAVMGADGDRDGVRDPHDLDDAALAAGVYLCDSGGDLSTTDGARAAVYQYNHSYDYVDVVLSYAAAYARGDYPTFAGTRSAVGGPPSSGSSYGGNGGSGGGSGDSVLAAGQRPGYNRPGGSGGSGYAPTNPSGGSQPNQDNDAPADPPADPPDTNGGNGDNGDNGGTGHSPTNPPDTGGTGHNPTNPPDTNGGTGHNPTDPPDTTGGNGGNGDGGNGGNGDTDGNGGNGGPLPEDIDPPGVPNNPPSNNPPSNNPPNNNPPTEEPPNTAIIPVEGLLAPCDGVVAEEPGDGRVAEPEDDWCVDGEPVAGLADFDPAGADYDEDGTPEEMAQELAGLAIEERSVLVSLDRLQTVVDFEVVPLD